MNTYIAIYRLADAVSRVISQSIHELYYDGVRDYQIIERIVHEEIYDESDDCK